jgi:GAF domain-containing protein
LSPLGPLKCSHLLQQQIDIDLNLNGEHKIGIAGRCVKEGKPQKVDDVHSPEEKDYIEAVKETQSQLSVPLKIGEHIIGVLSIEHPTPAAFGDEDVRNIELLAAQAAVAIENARRYEEKRHSNLRRVRHWLGQGCSVQRGYMLLRGHARTIREDRFNS